MKRFSWLFVMVLLVSPVFAQDDSDGGDGGLGDGGGLFGGGGNNGANRGGQAAAVDRLVTLRDMLAKASAPLTKDQEKALNTLLDKEIKTMTEALRAKFPEEAEAPAAGRGGQRPGQPGQAQGRGQGPEAGQPPAPGQARGAAPRGGFRGGAGVVVDTPLSIEIRRMNEELLGKVTASLKPEQQVIIKKWENDQIRARGGLDALKLTMNEAGAPLTAEQIPQIQALYTELNQSRAQLLRETQGQPDAAKLSQLDLATMSKVAKLLNDNQRKALLESMAKSRQ